LPFAQDLLLRAKHLFGAARTQAVLIEELNICADGQCSTALAARGREAQKAGAPALMADLWEMGYRKCKD
jgi:hypothetical protein